MPDQIGEVLFDFSPEEETEIKITLGERVTVVGDIGEGWVEGINSAGDRGIFPKDYVRIISSSPSPIKSETAGVAYDAPGDDWGDASNENHAYASPVKSENNISHDDNASSNLPEDTEDANVSAFCGRYMNRFSWFVKLQAEDYILGVNVLGKNTDVERPESWQVVNSSEEGPIWIASSNKLPMKIINYTKGENRGAGLLSGFLYFLVTSEHGDPEHVKTVKRKYEHFEWLYEHLKRKYPLLIVPVLPPKVSPEEAALTKHIKLLNIWAEQLMDNPVIQQSQVLTHFLEIEDSKNFKKSRAQADKDKLTNGCLFKLVSIEPSSHISVNMRAPSELQKAKRLHDCLTKTFDGLTNSTAMLTDAYNKSVSPGVQLMESSLKKMGEIMEEHKTIGTGQLGNALSIVSGIIGEINADISTKPRIAQMDVTDCLWVHKEKLRSWPTIFQVNELTIEKYKDADRIKKEQAKKSETNLQANEHNVEIIKYRCDRVVTTSQAELNHHIGQVTKDTKDIMLTYLQRQMEYHEELAAKYKRALQVMDQVRLKDYN